ncbi:hypothetical protein B296_00029096, partial [Ensete ventricosum]
MLFSTVLNKVFHVAVVSARYHAKLIGNGRFRSSPADFERYQRGREKQKEGEEEENLEISSTDPSPAGDFFSPHREKKCLLAWGEGTRRRMVRGSNRTELSMDMAKHEATTELGLMCSIPICTAWYVRYISVCQVTGTRIAHYRAVSPKLTVGGRFRPSMVDFGRWQSIEGEEERRKKKEEKKKEYLASSSLAR